MKPYYKKPPAPPETPLPFKPHVSIDEWLTRQADEVPDLLKMYAYAATLAKHRYEAFLAAGFTEEQSFELTKIYIAL